MNLQIGENLTPFQMAPVSPEAMKEWAVFLRDPNPIHLDVEVVKAKGLGDRVINQGPINVAYIINMLQNNFPNGIIESLDTSFLDNVYGGDNVEAFGTITELEQSENGDVVNCDIGLNIEDRGLVISGKATIRLAKS